MTRILRKSSHILKWNSKVKETNMDILFDEYQKLVQFYIDALWTYEFVSFKYGDKKLLDSADTWVTSRMKQCAGKQAIQIIKSTQKKNKELVFKQYRRVFAKAKSRDKKWEILNSRFSEWIKGRVFKKVSKPVFDGNSIELDDRFVTIEDGENSFDLWIKLESIGNKIIFYVPTRKHKHFLLGNTFFICFPPSPIIFLEWFFISTY